MCPLPSLRRDSVRRRVGVSYVLTSWALVCTALLAPTALRAAGDDWSLERKASDPELVTQRFTKLRRRPFDQRQWRALQRALGTDGLARRIDAALERDAEDLGLRILQARAALERGRPSKAASTLAEIEPLAGRWTAQVFSLRIDALEAAGNRRHAVEALIERAEGQRGADPGGTRTKLLERAHALADRGNMHDEALRLARMLAEDGGGLQAQLRLARAAAQAGKGREADLAYARAIEESRARQSDDLVAERARARLEADNPSGASELLWSLLEPPRNGSRPARTVWWDNLADAHRRDGSTDLLITRLRAWLNDHGDEAAAWRTLAQAQETVGIDPVDAWRKTTALAPRDTESRAALVEALEAKGETKTAVAEYLDMLARHPSEAELGLEMASRLVASGDRELGLTIAREVESTAGRRSRNLLLLLDFYNLNEEPDLALKVARRLVESRPRSVDARIALGEQLYQMNRINEALAQWARLPKLIRPRHKGWARHAEILSGHGRTMQAVASLKKALEAAPHEPNYWRLRAVLAEEQRRPQQAMQAWEEVRRLARAPEHKLLRDEARTRLVELLVGGSISNRRMRLEHAEAGARAILERKDPLEDAVEAGRFLAELYTRRESYAAAVGIQQALLQLRPDEPDRLAELATAQRRAGQTQSALQTLEELLALEPSRSAEVLAEMSELAFEAGDADRALENATRAARKDRTRVDALVRLGELHEREGDVNEAARAYDKALQTTPDDVRARLRLAELELTRGHPERSARIFRQLLESTGPPELLREAGRRALDLAEASDSTLELLDLAVRRTIKHPEAAEPREFLIEALDRVTSDEVQQWLAPNGGARRSDRVAALRRPLVVALGRGSVGARLRAAEHLGELELPDTAVALAKMGAQLAAPRDATTTVREAFERTRIEAIRAAGSLRDAAAVPVFAGVLDDSGYTLHARRAAAWALARAGTAEATKALVPQLRTASDPLMAALGCIALAGRPATEVDPDDALTVAVLARDARQAHVRHVCSFAEAALTPDRGVGRLMPLLESSDPILAAVAAWRLGRVARPDEETVEALLRRFVGPPGLPRDAAGAAMSGLLGPGAEPVAFAAPPPPRGNNWANGLERWLVQTVAPRYSAVEASRLQPHARALRSALRAGSRGTRAERAAVRDVLRPCDSKRGEGPSRTALCLAPLVEQTIRRPADTIDN